MRATPVLANMLVALLLPCVAALLPRAAALLYTTQLEKSVGGAAALRTAGFSIPAGQCSGYIDQSLVCGARGAAALRLRVRDAAFAALHVDDALRSATVTRALCHAPADVELAVACEPAARTAATAAPPATAATAATAATTATAATAATTATGDSGARRRRHALPPAPH